MNIIIKGGEISDEEKNAYIDHVKNKNKEYIIDDLTIELDGDFVNLTYNKHPIPFERLRRITGYLTTTLDKWNDGKRAEEADRVKHGINL